MLQQEAFLRDVADSLGNISADYQLFDGDSWTILRAELLEEALTKRAEDEVDLSGADLPLLRQAHELLASEDYSFGVRTRLSIEMVSLLDESTAREKT